MIKQEQVDYDDDKSGAMMAEQEQVDDDEAGAG